MNKIRWIYGAVALVFIGLLILGYDYYRRHSEQTLMTRAQLYWDAVRVNDLYTAYNLEAEKQAGTLYPHQIRKRQDWGVRLVGFSLGAVTYYGDHAEVEVTREMTWPDSREKSRIKPPIKDLWTFMNGEWFHGSPEKGSSLMRKSPRD